MMIPIKNPCCHLFFRFLNKFYNSPVIFRNMRKNAVLTGFYFPVPLYLYLKISGTVRMIKRTVTKKTVDITVVSVARIKFTILIRKEFTRILQNSPLSSF